jgi:hypothetical protein
MRRTLLAIPAVAAAALVAAIGAPGAGATGHQPATCGVLPTPAGLGATLLRLHRAYERTLPDVHNPHFTGPVGPVHVGICGSERYASANFDARYNGHYFGIQDGPERFVKPAGQGWRDIGNTGGDPCGSAPTGLLVAWGIVRSCPG